MDWKFLFLSLKGRIRRWHWWIGTIIVILLNYAISIPLLWLLGGDPNYYWNDAMPTKEVSLADTLAFLATLHFSLSVDIKRIHDRGRSAYLLVPVYLFSLGLFLSESFSWNPIMVWVLAYEQGEKLPFNLIVFIVTFSLLLLYILWLLFELGFRKGTSGESKYGPDPLAPDLEKKLEI